MEDLEFVVIGLFQPSDITLHLDYSVSYNLSTYLKSFIYYSGACCDQSSCGFMPKGTVCRRRHGDCDFEEVCDGESAQCPEDQWRIDGTDCNNHGWSFCYQGKCTTYDAVCKSVYEDPAATSANAFCYEHEGEVSNKITQSLDLVVDGNGKRCCNTTIWRYAIFDLTTNGITLILFTWAGGRSECLELLSANCSCLCYSTLSLAGY